MIEKKAELFNAQVNRMCFDQDSIYTSTGKAIFRWDKKSKELMSSFTVPPNDNLKKPHFYVPMRKIFISKVFTFFM